MVKYGKMVVGLLVNLVAGLIGSGIWMIIQDDVKMPKSHKESATLLFLVAFVSAAAIFAFWYIKTLKFQVSAASSNRKPKVLVFYGTGVIAAAAITIIGGFIFYPKAVIYSAIIIGCVAIGSFLSYYVGQPK